MITKEMKLIGVFPFLFFFFSFPQIESSYPRVPRSASSFSLTSDLEMQGSRPSSCSFPRGRVRLTGLLRLTWKDGGLPVLEDVASTVYCVRGGEGGTVRHRRRGRASHLVGRHRPRDAGASGPTRATRLQP